LFLFGKDHLKGGKQRLHRVLLLYTEMAWLGTALAMFVKVYQMSKHATARVSALLAGAMLCCTKDAGVMRLRWLKLGGLLAASELRCDAPILVICDSRWCALRRMWGYTIATVTDGNRLLHLHSFAHPEMSIATG